MKKFKVICIYCLLSLVLACGKKDGGSDNFITGPETGGRNIENLKFKGTAKTTIKYYDVDAFSGRKIFLQQKTFNKTVFVYKEPAKKLGSISETNPFNLMIDTETAGAEGDISIISAMILNDAVVGKVLLQYWNFSMNGKNFTGTLTNTHMAESCAMNFFWAMDQVIGNMWIVGPIFIPVNTRLQGTIDNQQVHLNIQFEAFNHIIASEIVANVTY